MPENRRSEGFLVTLENATAASNIAAGTMVATESGLNTIFSADREVAGLTASASLGSRIIGVLDERWWKAEKNCQTNLHKAENSAGASRNRSSSLSGL